MSLTGKETVNLVGLDNNGFPAGVSQDVPLNSIVAVHSTLAHLTVKTDTAAATLAAADVAGANASNIVLMSGTLAAGATLTLPTVAAIV